MVVVALTGPNEDRTLGGTLAGGDVLGVHASGTQGCGWPDTPDDGDGVVAWRLMERRVPSGSLTSKQIC
jgi:hypothetical protein